MDFLNWLKEYLTVWNIIGFIFCSGVVVEFTPIKLCPVSSILNWIGKRLNKEVEKKMSEIDKKVDKVDSKVDTVQLDLQNHKVESWRRDILSFADSLSMGKAKTKENYLYIISLHDSYQKYIEERGLVNGQIDVAFSYIILRYNECLENNSFYTGK
jgi:hypothetical protein